MTKWIYALVDPDEPDEIRYVGESSNPPQRLSAHQNGRSGAAVVEWTDELKAAGRTPDLVILHECEDRDADTWERHFIHRASMLGNRVLNVQRKAKAAKAATLSIPDAVLRLLRHHAMEKYGRTHGAIQAEAIEAIRKHTHDSRGGATICVDTKTRDCIRALEHYPREPMDAILLRLSRLATKHPEES